MWLAVKLYERGFVTAQQLADALVERVRRTPPMGQLAVATGRMSMHQLSQLLYEQADDRRRFGDLAVALGMLTEADLAELVALQQQQAPAVEAILLERGEVSPAALERLKSQLYEDPVPAPARRSRAGRCRTTSAT
jgi:hypothetical protein